MTQIYKPRGLQKPSYKETGISHLQLIRFIQDCQVYLEREGEKDSAFRFEMIHQYLSKDFKPGTSLKLTGTVLGF